MSGSSACESATTKSTRTVPRSAAKPSAPESAWAMSASPESARAVPCATASESTAPESAWAASRAAQSTAAATSSAKTASSRPAAAPPTTKTAAPAVRWRQRQH